MGYVISKDLETRIKWLGRFFDLHINKYIDWNVSTREEDGGSYDHVKSKAKTLPEAILIMWAKRDMDNKLKAVLVHRDLNYRYESDEELGILGKLAEDKKHGE